LQFLCDGETVTVGDNLCRLDWRSDSVSAPADNGWTDCLVDQRASAVSPAIQRSGRARASTPRVHTS
jgi:hypothetical protein